MQAPKGRFCTVSAAPQICAFASGPPGTPSVQVSGIKPLLRGISSQKAETDVF